MSKNLNIPWNQFGKLQNERELSKYFADREYTHGDYCHYTRIRGLNGILERKEFRLGCVSRFNDKLDTKQFGDESNLYYALCFSTGVNENLALWYLYAGMDGRGARIRLTKSIVRKLIDNARLSLCEIIRNEKGEEISCEKVLDLTNSVDVELKFKDVLYSLIDSQSHGVKLKYNTMTNYNISQQEFNSYRKKNRGFMKGLIWYYEKETRLLAKLKGSAAELVLNTGKEYVIQLGFDDTIYKNIAVDFAPEISDISSVVEGNDGIRKFVYGTSNTKLSDYVGTVKMDLCGKCDKLQSKL